MAYARKQAKCPVTDCLFILFLELEVTCKISEYNGSPTTIGGKKLAFARRQILQQSSTLIVHLYFSSTISFCTFLKKYQKQGSRVRHSVLPLLKSCFATSFSRCTPRRSLLVAMLGVARTRCAQTSCRLFPSIARLLAVPPNAALTPLAENYL